MIERELEAILARLNENFPDAIISGMQSFASFLDHQDIRPK